MVDELLPLYMVVPFAVVEAAMKNINGEIFLTTQETAKAFAVSSRTIQKWCSDNGDRPESAPDLQPVKGPSGRLHFRMDHINSLVVLYFGRDSDKSFETGARV